MGLAVLAFAVLFANSGLQQRLVYDPGNGVTLPKLIKEVKPNFPGSAMKKKLRGRVLLQGVVDENGRVTDIKVLQAVDPDIDEAAIDAFKEWQFKLGTREGVAVAVRISSEFVYVFRPK